MEQNHPSQNPSAPLNPGHIEPARFQLDGLQHLNEQQLESLLHSLQRRLGTNQEMAGDFDYVRVVAHELNNLLTVRRLRQGLAVRPTAVSA